MKKILLGALLAISTSAVAQTYSGVVVDVQTIAGQYSSDCDRLPQTFTPSNLPCNSTKFQQQDEYIIVVKIRDVLYRFRTKRHYLKGELARVIINAVLED